MHGHLGEGSVKYSIQRDCTRLASLAISFIPKPVWTQLIMHSNQWHTQNFLSIITPLYSLFLVCIFHFFLILHLFCFFSFNIVPVHALRTLVTNQLTNSLINQPTPKLGTQNLVQNYECSKQCEKQNIKCLEALKTCPRWKVSAKENSCLGLQGNWCFCCHFVAT